MSVLEETHNTMVDYHKLKSAVASIPQMELVSAVMCLFSNNNVYLEFGFEKHLGTDVIANWMSAAGNMKTLDFLDDVDGVLEY